MHVKIKLTVFFEEPFWVGVFEKYEDNLLSVCKVVFGGEPNDFEVYDFLLIYKNTVLFSFIIFLQTIIFFLVSLYFSTAIFIKYFH
jgi:hypothetical protein